MSSYKKAERPGICALECYFPKLYVCQRELEEFDKASSGKYTIGLGQQEMAFCSDHEDVYSLALTVVSELLKNNNISERDIGRLSVASETVMDHSKSIKSVVMQLFEKSGNTDIEGVDYLHACYAGIASLFDSINWIQSESWDGRYAIIVCVDIAEYAQGAARPTGGAAAVAALIGPNAPIQIGSIRASYMSHAYDFYKPYLDCPYPRVDGHLSNKCFLQSLDECYKLYHSKYKIENNESFRSDMMDYWMFHSAFNKLVRKGFARVIFNDFYHHAEDSCKYPCLFKQTTFSNHRTSRANSTGSVNEISSNKPDLLESTSSCLSAVGGVGGFEAVDIHQYKDMEPIKTYNQEPRNTELINAFVKYSTQEYDKKVSPSTFGPRKLGNAYTASLMLGLCSLVSELDVHLLMGRKVGAFSYGSGICSTLFSFEFGNDEKCREMLQTMRQNLSLRERLNRRRKMKPQEFNDILKRREEMFHIRANTSYKPVHSYDYVYENAFVLTEIDKHGRRFYSRCREQKKKAIELRAHQLEQEHEQKHSHVQPQPQLQSQRESSKIQINQETQTIDTIISTPLKIENVQKLSNRECTKEEKKEKGESTVVSQKESAVRPMYLLSFALGGVATLATYLAAEKLFRNNSSPANKK